MYDIAIIGGGLIAPDAQKFLASFGLGIPKTVRKKSHGASRVTGGRRRSFLPGKADKSP
jgi:hypothetical protein